MITKNPTKNIQHLGNFQVAGYTIRTTAKNGQESQDIGKLWGRFMADNLINTIPNRINNDLYAVYYNIDFTHGEKRETLTYDFMIGAKVSDITNLPEGMKAVQIPARTYTVFTAQGDFQTSVPQAWNEIWQSNIKRRFEYDFEHYTEDYTQLPEKDRKVDIFIGTHE